MVVAENSQVHNFMTSASLFIDNFLFKHDHINNSKVIYESLKSKSIDIEALEELFAQLPEGEWDVSVLIEHQEQINKVFGISNEEIMKHSVQRISKQDIIPIRWRLIVESFQDYAVFATENYDAMKYDDTPDLSMAKLRLFNEFMLVFERIKAISQEVYKKYKNSTNPPKDLKKIFIMKMPIDLLLMRIIFISLNLDDADDNKINSFADLLGKERISIQYQRD